MQYEKLLEKLNAIPNGRFVRVLFGSEPTLRASAKTLGWKVVKMTVSTFQKGVSLKNVKRYQEQEAARTEPKKVYTQWKEWVIPNLIQRNLTSGKHYLHLVTLPKNSNPKSYYRVTSPDGETQTMSREQVMALDIVQPSQWAKKESPCLSVNIEHVMDIY